MSDKIRRAIYQAWRRTTPSWWAARRIYQEKVNRTAAEILARAAQLRAEREAAR